MRVQNTDDIIDSRDVIQRIDEIESELESDYEQYEKDTAYENGGEAVLPREAWQSSAVLCDQELVSELAVFKALAEQCEGYADWEYGEPLIRYSYFKEYAQELADEIGAIDRNATWPVNCIDWNKAARELQVDYAQVDFDGVLYWIRSC